MSNQYTPTVLTQNETPAEAYTAATEKDLEQHRQLDMQALRRLFPANEIVKKSYEPDLPPKLKLLSLERKLVQKHKRTQQRYFTMQISRSRFNEWDTLNNYFCNRLDELVYVKFDNQRSMSTHAYGKTVQYFAGFFQPPDNFAPKEPKDSNLPQKTHNIYQAIQSLRFQGFHNDIKNLFGVNSLNNEDCIRFSSGFESGNLFAAFRTGSYEYELVLQNDVNSRGNTQWFNFAVDFNIKTTYRFKIINLTKSDSLYNLGMKIMTFSHRDYEINKHGWTRSCSKILYKPTDINREGISLKYYSLSFEFTPQYQSDVVVFANCFPYTYTELQTFIGKKMARKKQLRIAKIPIGKSISGLPLYVIKLGETPKVIDNVIMKSQIKRKSLVFMARQHSGETPASYVIEGIMEALIESREFDLIKRQFVIHIIPMVNPDGVYYGNYRTNLSGTDLNRKWRNPSRTQQPEIYFLRKYLCEINRVNPISLIIDFHGHSRKLGSFFYGNPSNEMVFCQNTKIFPLLCSKRNKRISYNESTFLITQDKRNTARVVLHQLFPQALVYTFEASFYGFEKQKVHQTVTQEFSTESYRRIGRDILQGYMDYLFISSRNHYQVRDRLLREISVLSKNIITDDNGSDSEPQQDSADVNTVKESQIVIPPPRNQKYSKTVIIQKIVEVITKQDPSPDSVEMFTQTQLVKPSIDKKDDRNAEGCLSILRIVPLKGNVSIDKSKMRSPAMIYPRGESLDALQSYRRNSNDLDKLRRRLAARDKFAEKSSPSVSITRDRLLCIKNIPLLTPNESRCDLILEPQPSGLNNSRSLILKKA